MIRWSLPFLAFLLANSTSGHHAFSAFYDTDNVGDLRGELIEIFWINPHAGFRLRTDDGEVWDVRDGARESPSSGSGWRKRSAWATRSRSPERFSTARTKRDAGNEHDAARRLRRSSWTGLRGPPGSGGTGVSRSTDEGGPPAAIRRFGARGHLPRMVPRPQPPATATRSFRLPNRRWRPGTLGTPVRDDPALRCIAPGMPVAMDTPFPIAFEEGDGRIILRIEQWDGVRSLHMGNRYDSAGPAKLADGLFRRALGRADAGSGDNEDQLAVR